MLNSAFIPTAYVIILYSMIEKSEWYSKYCIKISSGKEMVTYQNQVLKSSGPFLYLKFIKKFKVILPLLTYSLGKRVINTMKQK